MKYTYKTNGTCCTEIKMDIDGKVITNVEFTGGCKGNLKAIPRLIDGWTVDEIKEKCQGITCGNKSTSCADQLAYAVCEAYEEAKAQ